MFSWDLSGHTQNVSCKNLCGVLFVLHFGFANYILWVLILSHSAFSNTVRSSIFGVSTTNWLLENIL